MGSLSGAGDHGALVVEQQVPNMTLARWLMVGAAAPALIGCSTVDSRPEMLAGDMARPAVRDLQAMLATRDAEITALERRVAELEQGGRASTLRPGRALEGGLPEPAAGPAPWLMAQAGAAPSGPGDDGARGSEAAGGGGDAAPGQFEVDEDDVDRALERTLVQAGALLLPFGKVEVEPAFRYTRREGDVPVFVNSGGTTFIGEDEVQRNEFEAALGLRVGLPFDTQLELDLPYQLVDQSTVTRIGGSESGNTDDTGHGIGDLGVSVAKTLVRERGWVPDLIGRVRWDTATGKTDDNDIALGGGFHEVGGSITATKRQDPLVFIGRVGYEHTFENDDIQPGDQFDFTLGVVLAASPETSLRLLFTQQYVDDLEIGGQASTARIR